MQLASLPVSSDTPSHRRQQVAAGRPGLFASLAGIASIAPHRREQPISRPEATHDYWYQIIRGGARQCASRSDGQRLIIDFILPGDVFVPVDSGPHFVVEAITDDTIVAIFPRQEVEQLADFAACLSSELRDVAQSAAYRLQRHILILGRVTAVGKVSAFVLDMAERLSADPGCVFELPMSRYDIADYLAMSVETVSRALTSLRDRRAIVFSGLREIRIVDRAALEGGDAGLQ